MTADRQRQENVFQELQHAIDFLDHAPAGFFSAGPDGAVSYMNKTLAGWLGYDLTQVGSGGATLSSTSSPTTARRCWRRSPAGRARCGPSRSTSTCAAATAARCRCACCIASPSVRTARAGASRTLVLNRAVGRAAGRGSARRRSALRPLLQLDADGDRDARRRGPRAPLQRRLRQAVAGGAQGRAWQGRRAWSVLAGLGERDRAALRKAIAGRDRQARATCARSMSPSRKAPAAALGALLRVAGGGRRQEGRDDLCARHDRAAQAAGRIRAVAEDASGRPARRRRRA